MLITIDPDTTIEEAARIMVKHKIGCLPVAERGYRCRNHHRYRPDGAPDGDAGRAGAERARHDAHVARQG